MIESVEIGHKIFLYPWVFIQLRVTIFGPVSLYSDSFSSALLQHTSQSPVTVKRREALESSASTVSLIEWDYLGAFI